MFDTQPERLAGRGTNMKFSGSYTVPALGALGLVLTVAVVVSVSCSSENTLGSASERLHDTTTIYITRHDTVFQDTLVVRELSFVPRDTSSILYFGLAADLTGFAALTQPYDSAYVAVNTFSDPIRTDLAVNVNSVALPRDPSRRLDMLFSGYFNNSDLFPLAQSSLYDTTVPKSAAYAFSVIVPIYPSDTSQPVSYDTVGAVATVPGLVDTIVCFDTAAAPLPTYVDTSGNGYLLMDNWGDVRATWPDSADFYLVSVTKLTLGMLGNPVTVGEPIDTMVADSEIVIPSSFLWMDESTPDSVRYMVASIDVIPFCGPTPDQWDTLPSFESHGILLGLRAEYTSELLFAIRPDTAFLAKRPAALGKRAVKSWKSAEEVVQEVLSRLKND
jgi:hypothetical protein